MKRAWLIVAGLVFALYVTAILVPFEPVDRSDPDFRSWEGSSGNIHEFDWSN